MRHGPGAMRKSDRLRRIVVAACIAFVAVGLGAEPVCAKGDAVGALVGAVGHYQTKESDTFVRLARRFDVGYVALMAANPGVDPWLPGARQIELPTAHVLPDAPHRGIVINIVEMRLYYFDKSGTVATYPIGVAHVAEGTPLGTTRVVRKAIHPTWVPTPNIREERPELPAAIPPGPDNPLGDYALYLGWPLYTIHGTNKPAGVGRRVSHGCIRLYPEDIAALYPRVGVGTSVTVVFQIAKAGWVGNQLYLEIHPSLTQADQIEQTGKFSPEAIDGLDEIVWKAAGPDTGRINWRLVLEAAMERRGIPVQITQ